ncbi:hypothetical protein H0W32_02610 [Patescibacteria group bacterium]|nr:hypothetical protein [Patescibacteria group bacterium]
MKKQRMITIDMLAGMMNRSFEHFEKKMDEGFALLRGEMTTGFINVEDRLNKVENRLDKIESKVDSNNENRLSHLEDDVRIIKTKLEL